MAPILMLLASAASCTAALSHSTVRCQSAASCPAAHIHSTVRRQSVRAPRVRSIVCDGSAFVVDASYNLAAGAAVVGTICGGLEDIKGADGEKLPTAKLFGGSAVLFVVFAAFLAFQTTTLRFTFDDSDLSLVKADGASTGENVVVGGENRWKYNTFVNWDFLPSEEFPILVYCVCRRLEPLTSGLC